MKPRYLTLLLLFIPFVWMNSNCNTLNPFFLKGPDFLRFYAILLAMVYIYEIVGFQYANKVHVIALPWWRRNGLLLVALLLGIGKLRRGIYLGRPVGYLLIILLTEFLLLAITASIKKRSRPVLPLKTPGFN